LNDIKLKFEEFFKATFDFSEQNIKSESLIPFSNTCINDSIIEEKKNEEVDSNSRAISNEEERIEKMKKKK
jgi:hypothetical protein